MEILGVEVLAESSATVTKAASYLDRNGRRKSWSYIERVGGRQAVVVAARTRSSGALVMIRQYRVPFARALIELPAGLVDPGESPEQAALRELEEETGYSGEIARVGPAVSSSAGLTTETFYVVDAVVDEVPRVAPRRGGSEDMEVFTVAPGEARARLEEWRGRGELLDCKAYLVLAAMAPE
jgi:8-oxo-dGTP pyrophosphatase MutT (NUDIX family)